ncbi:MAG: HD family hydrolase [Pseudomonadota bacterium]
MAARSSKSINTPRVWQRMLSGRRLDLLDPSPMDIEIEDIAHGLARVARWNGQTTGSYAFSVAQHSLVVVAICETLFPTLKPEQKLMALLHDGPEYVIGDMISPFKAILGDSYKDIEQRLEEAIHLRFGLPARTPKSLKKMIKHADRVCAWFEAIQLAGFKPEEADKFFGHPPDTISLDLVPDPAEDAQAQFIAKHVELLTAVEAGRAA